MKPVNILIIIFTITNGILSGQDMDKSNWRTLSTTDFSKIREQTEAYFAKKGEDNRGEEYFQWKKWEYLNSKRLLPDGKITNYILKNQDAYRNYLKKYGYSALQGSGKSIGGNWSFLTPTSYVQGAGSAPGLGRINCIAFHPTNPDIFFVGTPAGGLWKTTNSGYSWTSLTDGIPCIGISGIAINPFNPDNIFILTGDGDGRDTPSIGVLVTYDGGYSWSETDLKFSRKNLFYGYKLIMHPSDPNILFAATTIGLYRTIDGGQNWSFVKYGAFYDVKFKPGTPSVVYATKGSSFLKSNDTGATWTEITAGVPSNANRMEIGVSPANPNYVYLLCGPSYMSGTFTGLRLSTNSGNSFATQSYSPNILGYSQYGDDAEDQSGYDLTIAVSPTNISNIITGGINVWASYDYGVNWSIKSYHFDPNNSIGYTHADIHTLAINPLNNYLYCGSDGGIFVSTDFGENWTDISAGLGITQFYRIAGYEPNPNLLISGTQDNGANKWTGGYSFIHIMAGDGTDCMIDYTNPDILYYTYVNGGLHKSFDGGATNISITPDGSTGAWITPLLMDPTNANIIYGGYDDVYKSTDGGGSWTNTGADGRGALAMGTSNPNRIYASHNNYIYRSDDGGGSWIDITGNGLVDYNISAIAVNPDNSFDVFVTISGFLDGEKVYESNDGGSTWTNITGTLPDVIVNCIAYEDRNGSPDDAIYIGTDVGIFYRNNSLGDWIPFSNGLPVTIVLDIEINEPNNLITAATYGRGLWRSDTYSYCEQTLNLSGSALPGYSMYQASDHISSTSYFNKGAGQEGYYKAGNYVKLNPGFSVSNGSKFKAYPGPCNGGIPAKQQDKSQKNNISN